MTLKMIWMEFISSLRWGKASFLLGIDVLTSVIANGGAHAFASDTVLTVVSFLDEKVSSV